MFSTFFSTLKFSAILEIDGKLTVKNYFGFIFRRYLRVAPVYYFIFLFGWLIGPSIGSGPCWLTYEKGFTDC
jgi:hypothetical protein